MPVDLAAVEAAADAAWKEARVDEPKPDPAKRPFLATYPYSYMNAYAHVGHGYTMIRNDLMVRYQRMKGRNTLFPFAYHLTGTPIVAAANRVREGEPSQLKIMKDLGIADEELPKFADPIKWVEHFPPYWRRDARRLGLAIDWRREFCTTELNPFYDAFIRWQFRKLKEKGLVRKGKHPVIWCPKDKAPVADHDRAAGEGETPQEYVLIKLRRTDAPEFLVAATLRPETMFGQTNVWVRPDIEYARLPVGDETWIVSPEAAKKLGLQLDQVGQPLGTVTGASLVGKKVRAPATDREIPILPASFVDPSKGTGVVTSVPSDAPDDHVALLDLARDTATLAEHGLDAAAIRALRPVPIIDTPGLGDLPAPRLVEQMRIKSQAEREPLQKAKEEVYRRGFYEGTMKPGLPGVGGLPVWKAKDAVKDMLVERGDAARFWEPSGKVVCRCLTPAVVKVVENQWFLAYGDEAWKEQVRACMARMRFYPETVRKQFENVVDWLKDWACARESGMGTRLPWDDKWIIESLSDSTIYMAYYTVSHLLEGGPVKPEDVKDNDAAFDFVFLGVGKPTDAARGTLTREILESMREEFLAFYPLAFRNSGKDLVQNHLTFLIYNHVAIFPEEHWPQSLSVNGWVTIDGAKMSKSAGNFILLGQALEQYGASATRLALANAGEGLDDANFERDFAAGVARRLQDWIDVATTTPRDARRGPMSAEDRWMRAELHRIVADTTAHFEGARFRSALKVCFFDAARAWSWYLRRTLERPHADIHAEFADVTVRLLCPFIPHACEHVWKARSGQGLAVTAAWPVADDAVRDPHLLHGEALVTTLLDDVRDILKLARGRPTAVRVFVAPSWKRVVHDTAARMAAEGKLDVGGLTKAVMHDASVKAQAKEAAKLAGQLSQDLQKAGPDTLQRMTSIDEAQVLNEAAPFLARELGVPVEVVEAGSAGAAKSPDGGKAARAVPWRPGVFVETA